MHTTRIQRYNDLREENVERIKEKRRMEYWKQRKSWKKMDTMDMIVIMEDNESNQGVNDMEEKEWERILYL